MYIVPTVIRVLAVLVICCHIASAEVVNLRLQPISPVSTFRHQSLSGSGDLNGDGYDDIVVGQSSFSILGSNRVGRIIAYDGKTGVELFRRIGESQDEWFGASVQIIPDFGGDGFDDIFVLSFGVSNCNACGTASKLSIISGQSGQVTQTFGGNCCYRAFESICGLDYLGNGLGAVAFVGASASLPAFTYLDTLYVVSAGQLKLDTILRWSVSELFLTGLQDDFVLANAGDIDGDGRDELVLGQANAGMNGQIISFDGSGNIPNIHWSRSMPQSANRLGAALAGGGDVNGDGFDDIVVGSGHLITAEAPGQVLVLSGVDGSTLWTFDDQVPTGSAFGSSVALADVNGDGKADIIVGAMAYGVVGAFGAVYVFSGEDGCVLQFITNREDGIGGIEMGMAVTRVSHANDDAFEDFASSQIAAGAQTLEFLGMDPNRPTWDREQSHLLTKNNSTGFGILDFDSQGGLDVFIGSVQGQSIVANSGSCSIYHYSFDEIGIDVNAKFGSWADIDNDGDLDFFMRSSTAPFNRLFINTGASFVNLTPSWLTSSMEVRGLQWADFNKDGLIDMFVTVRVGSTSLTRDTAFIALNLDGTNFQPLGKFNAGRVIEEIAIGDYNGDDFPDLYITGFGLLRNNAGSGWSFDNNGITAPTSEHHCQWIDFDNDGDLDLFVEGDLNHLWRNDQTAFVDIIPDGLLSKTLVSFLDFDNDGDIDFIARGPQGDSLQENDGLGVFTAVTEIDFNRIGEIDDLVLVADMDIDGDLDMFDGKHLIRNNVVNNNHWIGLSLKGTTTNMNAIGAQVTVTSGGVTQMKQVTAGSGTPTRQGPFQLHFGIGASTVVDEVSVRWPAGHTQQILGLGIDQIHHIEEPPVPNSLEVSETFLGFETVQNGAIPPIKTFQVKNGGNTQVLNWQIAEDATWLNVSPVSGSSDAQQITVSVNTTNLVPGDYAATITVSSDNSTNSPQTVQVDYTVSSCGELAYLPNKEGWVKSNQQQELWWPDLSKDFPDWPTFVSAFAEFQCFHNDRDSQRKQPKPLAQKLWNCVKNRWDGSCYGMALTSLALFDEFHTLQAKLPTSESLLYNVNPSGPFQDPLSISVRDYVNKYHVWQFGYEQMFQGFENSSASPTTEILPQIQEMLLSTNNGDHKVLNLLEKCFQHSVIPYRCEIDPNNSNIVRVIVYDPNFPVSSNLSSENFISFDLATDTWSYDPDIPALGFQRQNTGSCNSATVVNATGNLYLGVSIDKARFPPVMFRTSALPKMQILCIANWADRTVRSGLGFLEDSWGNIQKTWSEIQPIIRKEGADSVVLGYALPPSDWSIELSSPIDSVGSVIVFMDSIALEYRSMQTDTTQTENVSFAGSDTSMWAINKSVAANETNGLDGKTVNANTLVAGRNYEFELISQDRDSTIVWEISETSLQESDSVRYKLHPAKHLLLENYGQSTVATISIDIVGGGSPTGIASATFEGIPLIQDFSYLVVADWRQFTDSLLVIADSGHTGTFNDSLFFVKSSCCSGSTGNVDNDPSDIVDIADLTQLIDHLFINFPPLDCPEEGNVDGDPANVVDIADLTALIDHLFINFPPTAVCQ